MNISDLLILRCPYCNDQLELKRCIRKVGDNVRQGVVSCGCDEYPIVESILLLKKPVNRIVLQNLLLQNYQHAFNRLVDIQWGYNRLLKLVGPNAAMSRVYQLLFLRSLLRDIGYRNTILPLSLFQGTRQLAKYLLRLPRSHESHVPNVLLSYLPKQPKTIVDVGCGVTAYAPSLSVTSASSLLGIDNNFTLLHLSNIFFNNPRQSLVCMDLSHGFPIKSHSTDLIFSLNCLTYLYNQKQTWISMLSSAKKEGLVFLGDLYSTTHTKLAYRYPRKPSFYTRHIPKYYVVFDYEQLLQQIAKNKVINFNHLIYRHKEGRRYGVVVSDFI